MKGCYCLIINVESENTIKIGKKLNIQFDKGYYIYVGSAMNSLMAIIKRHLSDEKKTSLACRLLIKKCQNH